MHHWNKVLLTLDNHPSHITIAALDNCKINGITMLSFPSHCTHKLQPVDRSLNGPLKKAVNSACASWMRNHPGRPMTIHDIPSIVATAYPIALTPRNIQGGFKVTGIAPFNRDIFEESDYSPSFVTDRPDPTSTNPVVISTSESDATRDPLVVDPLSYDVAEAPSNTCQNLLTNQTPIKTCAVQVLVIESINLPCAPPHTSTLQHTTPPHTSTPPKPTLFSRSC